MGTSRRAAVVALGVALVGAATGCTTPPPPTGSFDLVSANAAGTDSGNGGSGRNANVGTSFVVSADGSAIAFHSYATDLGPEDPGASWDSDIYVRDLGAGTTVLATVNAPGQSADNGDGSVTKMALSADGTTLAFTSTAQNLVPSDTNGVVDVFVRDLVAGTTELVSANASGTDSGDSWSNDFALSPDGTQVAFTSSATDLGPATRGDTSRSDVYLRDLATDTTTLVSVGPDGLDGTEQSWQPAFSPQGDAVAFTSADSLGAEVGDGRPDVFLRRLPTGVTSLVSTAVPAPAPAQTRSFSAGSPVFRPDGGAVAYEVDASYGAGSQVYGYHDIVLTDLGSGAVQVVSAHPVPTGGTYDTDRTAWAPQFSPDGTKVLFQANSGYYGPTDTNQRSDVYLRDLAAGSTSLVSVDADGTDAAGGHDPHLSADGEAIVFSSASDALGSADDPDDGLDHIYVRDLAAGRTTLVAAGAAVPYAVFYDANPTFLGVGRRLAFVSESDALVPTDTNADSDVFLGAAPG